MSTIVTDYLDLVMAKITGDDAKVTSLKIQKQAASELKAQIAAKEAVTHRLEDKVEALKEAYLSALTNDGKVIGDKGEAYVTKLLSIERQTTAAKTELDNHIEDIEYLSNCLEEVKATKKK